MTTLKVVPDEKNAF